MVMIRCQLLDESVEPDFGKTCIHNSHGDTTRKEKYGCWVCRHSGSNTYDGEEDE